jgi:hypothetical protein
VYFAFEFLISIPFPVLILIIPSGADISPLIVILYAIKLIILADLNSADLLISRLFYIPKSN